MEAITVEQIGMKFFARCAFEQKDIVKAAGFRWDPAARRWWTGDPAVAAKFADAGSTQKFLGELEEKKTRRAEAVEQSRAATSDVEIPAPVEVAHVGVRGLMQRSSDLETIPLCTEHHRTGKEAQHVLGKHFWERHGIDREVTIKSTQYQWSENK